MTDLSLIAGAFLRAAERDFLASPLYIALAHSIAQDEEVLAIAQHSTSGQFPPYLLLTAVHSLLLEDSGDPLAEFYPSVAGGAVSKGDAYPSFRDYVTRHKDRVISIISSAHVNKSVLRRAAGLRPMIAEVAGKSGWPAVHLVDLGCGAGFNLLLDKWRIDYRGGGDHSVGPADSPVRVPTTLRGGTPPYEPFPAILSRTGLDLDHVEKMDAAHERWILGSQFPDDSLNLQLTREALPFLRRNPPQFVIGDAASTLGPVLDQLPEAAPVIVMHSLALVQMQPDQRQSVVRAIRAASARRPVARIGMEISGLTASLTIASGDGKTSRIVGEAEIDGAWLSWKAA
jgi:hypothetical protein